MSANATDKVSRAVAMAVGAEVCEVLDPVCERWIVAGSIRRRRPMVGDVEILYIPRFGDRQVDLFTVASMSLADDAIESMLRSGLLAKRASRTGVFAWGDKNKLAVHQASGIGVDLFAATEATWWNALVCRTGGAESNKRIASRAIARGYHWNVYGPGFTQAATGEVVPMESEEAVFEFVGLEYEEPWDRP